MAERAANGGGKPRRPRRSEPVTRNDVVAAAAGLFAERGFGNTRADDIADAVHIAKPTLYARTPGKWDLLQEIVDQVISALEADESKSDSASSIDALEKMFKHHVREAIRLRDYFRVALMDQRELPDDIRSTIRTRQQRYNRRVEKLIEQGIERGEIASDINPTVTTNNILGIANWACLWYRDKRSLTPDDVADASWDLIAKGLVPRS